VILTTASSQTGAAELRNSSRTDLVEVTVLSLDVKSIKGSLDDEEKSLFSGMGSIGTDGDFAAAEKGRMQRDMTDWLQRSRSMSDLFSTYSVIDGRRTYELAH
jgi:hypothetical protein